MIISWIFPLNVPFKGLFKTEFKEQPSFVHSPYYESYFEIELAFSVLEASCPTRGKICGFSNHHPLFQTRLLAAIFDDEGISAIVY